MPYGVNFATVFSIITAVFAVRYFFSAAFRDTDSGSLQLFFFIACWIILGVFYFRPTGVDTQIPPMENFENVKVRNIMIFFQGFNGNISFECPDDLLDRKISINTITRITVQEAMLIIDKRLETSHSYTEDSRGMSIARGPKIIITLQHKTQNNDSNDSEDAPYFYDRF